MARTDLYRVEYILDVGTPLTMVLAETRDPGGANEETISYLHGLDLVGQSNGSSLEYFAYDGLGSVRQVIDHSGTAKMSQTFDPYGSLYNRELETGWSVRVNYGFSGEQSDSSGMVFLRARYYDPTQGRFFQRDTGCV